MVHNITFNDFAAFLSVAFIDKLLSIDISCFFNHFVVCVFCIMLINSMLGFQ